MRPYSGVSGHPVHPTGVADVRFRSVFSVNLFISTGNARRVIDGRKNDRRYYLSAGGAGMPATKTI